MGHPLYADGDPRATALLHALRTTRPHSANLSRILQLANITQTLCGRLPNIDFALAANASAYELSADAAMSIFAAGRMAGWLAHALEQQEGGSLIRPRANYVGRLPGRDV